MTEFPGYPAGTQRPLMEAEGDGSSGIMLMGEALGEKEELDRLPFRPFAEAGSVLERALYRAGLDRKTLTITNLVWYRPPRNWLEGAPWEREAIRACWAMNNELIQERKPRVIVALGGLAMRELTGLSGEKQGIGMTRGFLNQGIDLAAGIPVIGSYHPSFLKRGSKEREKGEETPQGKTAAKGGGTGGGMALLGVMIRDLQLAADVAKRGAPTLKYDSYLLGATLLEWEQFYQDCKDHPEALIVDDWETTDTFLGADETEIEERNAEIRQVQMSWRPGQAIVSAWTPELREILAKIQALPNPKGDWNGRLGIDRRIWRNLEIPRSGEIHDLMDLWHFSQPDLPRGLQFATSFFCPEVGPWKHFSHSNPFLYGAFDADMPQRIWAGLRTSLKIIRNPISGQPLWGDGLYSGYSGQVARLAPVLDRMTQRGIPVDEDKREALDKEFSATLLGQFEGMQSLVADKIKGRHVYKKTPKAAEGSTPTVGGKTSIKIGTGPKSREVETTWSQVEGIVEIKCPEECWWSKPKKKALNGEPGADCPSCRNTGKVSTSALLWAKIEPFLPGSPQQVMAYIKDQREVDIAQRVMTSKGDPLLALEKAKAQTPWTIPTDYKTGNETTGEAELRRLAQRTKDPLLPLVLDYREISKLRGTYVEGWKPKEIVEFSAQEVYEAERKSAEDEEETFEEEEFPSSRRIGRVHPLFGFKPATGQLSCVAPWTLINTLGRGFPSIREVEVGDFVWTHKRRWRRVLRVWCKGRQEMFNVKFSDGQILTCTADHRLLLFSHEYLQEVDSRGTQCGGCAKTGPEAGISERRGHCEGIGSDSAYGGLDSASPHAESGVQGYSSTALFKVQDRRQEPTEGEASPQLYWGGRRWVRVSDLIERWKETVCTSDSNGRSSGTEGTSRDLRCSSYQRGHEGQPTGQLGSSNPHRAPTYSLPSSEGYTISTITEINPVGSYEVWDIEVEEDHSYAACGVFSHNSEQPNAQNFPTHSDLSHAMLKMISSRPGKRMVKFDWKSFHAITGGFEAGDQDFVRIARIDIHSFFVLVGILKIERPEVAFGWTDQELKDRIKFYRKDPKVYQAYSRQKHPSGMTFNEIRDELAKRIVYAWEFGQGPRSLYLLNQESFTGQHEAAEFQATLRRLFPKVDKWQDRIRLEADTQHCLVSRYGYVRRFWDVYQRKPVGLDYQPKNGDRVYEGKDGRRWLLKPGDDSEAAIAFLPANDAFGLKREFLVRLAELGLDEKYHLICDVHDDVRFEVERQLEDEMIPAVKGLMERKSEYLKDPLVAPDGLWCGVEAAIGADWDSMSKVEI